MTLRNLGLAAVFISFTFSQYTRAAGVDARPDEDFPATAAIDAGAAQRCAEVEALAAGAPGSAGKALAGLLSDPEPAVRACALRAMRSSGEAENLAAAETLLSEVDGYRAASGNKGLFEDNLKARLKAIDSIWALGELGDPRLMPKLAEFYSEADEVIKINLLISMGKLRSNGRTAPFLLGIAADPGETAVVRAAAFEMLEHIGAPAAVAGLKPSARAGMEKGDLIFTGGIVGTISGWVSPDMPVGHAGIFAGTEIKDGRIRVILADCVPNSFKPGGVRNIYAWHTFTRNYEFPLYGNRTSKLRPTAAQRERIVSRALAMGKLGLKYKLFSRGPAEFDCVNYTEFLYEAAGLNPTDDRLESGAGWPFTPWEQFESTRPDSPAVPLRAAADGGRAQDRELIRRSFSSLAGAFGLKGGQIPEIDGDIQPAVSD